MPDTVRVAADLRFSVRTPSGATASGRVTGDGREVRVDVDRPEVLLAVTDRADVGAAADLLAVRGVSVVVHGPRGEVATLGAGPASRLGALTTGSPRVRLRSVAAVGLLPPAARRGLAALAVAAVVLGARALTR